MKLTKLMKLPRLTRLTKHMNHMNRTILYMCPGSSIIFQSSLVLLTILLFFPSLSSTLQSEPGERPSTLVITYQSIPKGERLDRIRFWLKNEKNKQTLFPKGDAYVDDPEHMTRRVVIEDLPPGTYRLKFLVPNQDGYFRDIPTREITVIAGEIVKIDQKIEENHDEIELANIQPIFDNQIFDNKIAENKSAENKIQDNKIQDNKIQENKDAENRLEKNDNISEKNDNNSEKSNANLEINESKSENISNKPKNGKLFVSINTPNDPMLMSEIVFELTNKQGVKTIHPNQDKDNEIPLENGKMIMISAIPAGEYQLTFFKKDNPTTPIKDPLTIQIVERITKSVDQSF